MPLDTGSASDSVRPDPEWEERPVAAGSDCAGNPAVQTPAAASAEFALSSITDAATLGEGLRAAREASGKSLAELSAQTRVHRRYLLALEQNDHTNLPSRVFAIGHVRAYAAALGLDEHLSVERFRRETPDESTPLQPPTGAALQEVRRQSPRLIAAGVAVVLAVVGWNVFQRINLRSAAAPSDIAQTPESWSLGTAPGVVRLGAPRPAPPDQTLPALYVTPGLEAQLAGLDPEDMDAAPATGPVQAAFNPRGAIYGAEPAVTQVVIQARSAASLVVRMSDGRVLFARQLAPGEAWRAPAGVSATIDASEPDAFDIYLNGEHGGTLQSLLTPLAQLNARATERTRQSASDAVARTEALRRAAAAAAPAVAAVTSAPEASPPAIQVGIPPAGAAGPG